MKLPTIMVVPNTKSITASTSQGISSCTNTHSPSTIFHYRYVWSLYTLQSPRWPIVKPRNFQSVNCQVAGAFSTDPWKSGCISLAPIFSSVNKHDKTRYQAKLWNLEILHPGPNAESCTKILSKTKNLKDSL